MAPKTSSTMRKESPSNITKYCACQEKWRWWLMLVRHETSITVRGATGSPSNITKYCACHESLSSRFEQKISIVSANVKTWNLAPAPFGDLGGAFCMEKYKISRSGYLPKFHEMLPRPRKVTLQLHQILHLPRKSDSYDSSLPLSTLRYSTLMWETPSTLER